MLSMEAIGQMPVDPFAPVAQTVKLQKASEEFPQIRGQRGAAAER